MAVNQAVDKVSAPEQLRVNTVELPSPTASGTTTPVRTGNEKTVTEINLEFPKNGSSVTTPNSANRLNPFDTDIEAMHSSDNLNRKSVSNQSSRGIQNNSVWPGQDHWKQKARVAKMNNRSCTCLAHLSKRNRNIVKALIGLLVIGIAVGVGVGISKSLNAEIWRPRHS